MSPGIAIHEIVADVKATVDVAVGLVIVAVEEVDEVVIDEPIVIALYVIVVAFVEIVKAVVVVVE